MDDDLFLMYLNFDMNLCRITKELNLDAEQRYWVKQQLSLDLKMNFYHMLFIVWNRQTNRNCSKRWRILIVDNDFLSESSIFE